MASRAKAPKPLPPYQLVKGDPFNAALGLCAAFTLAAAKSLADVRRVPPVISWGLCAYTNWNLTFIALRLALNQQQWDPFLLCNSMGVLIGFRTAMTQGIDDNMRQKIAQLGVPLKRWQFSLADHACHTLPALLLLREVVRRKARVPHLTAIYAFVLASWFAFRQQAKLDSSGIYVPHPWRRAWIGIATGMLTMPPLVDALIAKRRARSAALAGVLLLPWLSTFLDPRLKATYDWKYALAKLQAARKEAVRKRHGAHSGSDGDAPMHSGLLRRVASEEPFAKLQALR